MILFNSVSVVGTILKPGNFLGNAFLNNEIASLLLLDVTRFLVIVKKHVLNASAIFCRSFTSLFCIRTDDVCSI
jgi:hypothetical protein